MNNINWVVTSVISIYIIIMWGTGLYFRSSVKTSDDYWIAGRSLGPWVVAFSYGATYYSTGAIINGIYYLYGMGYASWDAMGCAWLFALFPFLFLAGPLRRMGKRLGIATLPGLFAERYNNDFVRIYAAIVCVVMIVPYSTGIMKGIGNALSIMAGIPYVWGILITGFAISVYVTMSGFFGVAWTDFIQGWMIFLGLLVFVPRAFSYTGGLGNLVDTLKSIDKNLVSIPGGFSWGEFFTWTMVWGFTAWGQPQLLTRFFALKDEKTVGKCMLVAVTWSTVIITLMYTIGINARAIFPVKFMENPDLANASFISLISPHPIITAIFLGAVLAAAMSTIDSIFLTAASSIGRDVYEDYYLKKIKKEKVTQTSILKISRIVTIVVMFVSIVIALNPPTIVHKLCAFSTGVMGATFGAIVFYSLFWKRGNWQGCIASMVGGTVVTLIWYVFNLPIFYPYFPGTIASIILFPVVSLLTPPPSKQLVEKAFGTEKTMQVAS